MRSLQDVRAGRPAGTPDHSIHAEFAAEAFRLSFEDHDGGSGLVFSIASTSKRVFFGAGRCSVFPQNNATAATLAADKYFTNVILNQAGVPNLGGDYFFLHERHRAQRPPGHERADALAAFKAMGTAAFVKPLTGSRGDFAQAIHDEASFASYLDQVARTHDAIIVQRIVSGDEVRVFLLDGEVVYSARKQSPVVIGDGRRSIRELIAEDDARLQLQGISSVPAAGDRATLDRIPACGERYEVPGRMNLSAGGTMTIEADGSGHAAIVDLARRAAEALGLRAAGVDLFTAIAGDGEPARIIEVNANPSIRLLEDSDRSDLILTIWRHTFCALGLLDV